MCIRSRVEVIRKCRKCVGGPVHCPSDLSILFGLFVPSGMNNPHLQYARYLKKFPSQISNLNLLGLLVLPPNRRVETTISLNSFSDIFLRIRYNCSKKNHRINFNFSSRSFRYFSLFFQVI